MRSDQVRLDNACRAAALEIESVCRPWFVLKTRYLLLSPVSYTVTAGCAELVPTYPAETAAGLMRIDEMIETLQRGILRRYALAPEGGDNEIARPG